MKMTKLATLFLTATLSLASGAKLDKLSDFVEQVYKVDTAVIAAFYPEWLTRGKGAVRQRLEHQHQNDRRHLRRRPDNGSHQQDQG